VTSKCAACSGKGFIVEKPCSRCDGGLVKQRRSVTLTVPPGVVDGHVVRVSSSRGRPGVPDVIVHVKVQESPVFKRTLRDSADLLIDVPITYAEACLGKSVRVPTPEKPIALRVQPGSPSGKALRIPGQGMPRLDNPSQRGHLYARLQVMIPSELASQQHRLITQLSHYDDADQLRVHLFNGGR
jgi:molecular chaperone DnaJ